MKIYKYTESGRRVERDVTESAWRDYWADMGWVPVHSYPIPAKTVSRFIEHINGLDVLSALPDNTFQNLLQPVDIQNSAGNTVSNVPLFDFVLRWKRRGWNLKRMIPKSKALLSKKLILQRIRNSDSFHLTRTRAQVEHAFEWDRSPIPEWLYRAQRPVQYAREYSLLQRSHRWVVNRQWFIWAAREVNHWRIAKGRLGIGWGTGDRQKEIWSLVLLNGSKRGEPPRLVQIRLKD